MAKQGGTLANKNGMQLENLVKKILEDYDYQFVAKNKFMLSTNSLSQKFYTQQIPICESIYSTKGHEHFINADFVFYNPNNKTKYVIIECKSQTSSGSVDEKYPYLNENIKSQYPHKTIVILDAPAAKKGAKQWLKQQENTNTNLMYVFENFSDFRAWAIKNI